MSVMLILAVKLLPMLLLMGCARANLIAPLSFSQSAPCPVDDAGVAAAPVISENDARFEGFKRFSDSLEKWMNLTINPCDDFYGYTCRKGQTNNVTPQNRIAFLSGMAAQLQAYNDDAYFANAAKPLKQLKHLYDKCVHSDVTAAAVAESMKTKLESLKKKIGVNFPMAYQSELVSALSADDLANLIGFPIAEMFEGNLVTVEIFNDLKTPDEVSARVYIDQTKQMYSPDVYTNWSYYKPIIETEIVNDMIEFATILGVALDQARLKTDASAVAEMEYALRDYVTAKNNRRDFEKLYNLQTISELQRDSPAYNWIGLLKAALTKAQAPELITDSLPLVVLEPEQIAKLSRDIAEKKFDPATVANYIYYRVLTGLRKAAPPTSDKTPERKASELRRAEEHGIIDRRGRMRTSVEEISELGEQLNIELPEAQAHCVQMVDKNMPRASDRVFIDKVYPTPESRTNMHKELEELTKWVFSGFRTQIDQISWMTAETKKSAYKKMDNVQLNFLYSEWITDDDQLTEFYRDLRIADSFNAIQTYDAIVDFRLTLAVENFRLNKPRDRGAFGYFYTADMDAMYNPSFNSLNIFAGIVQPPSYDSKYPSATNFALIGNSIGHELSHGFDDEGVQMDYIGALNNWMDDSSHAGFKKMANCVVDEYSAFCPTSDFCVDGVNNQGENIADNGGLIAAYNAFQAYQAYYGPDPRLPGFGSKFSNDQLFFLSFSHDWCWPPMTEYHVTTEPHSPPEYRVFGALQNFPAFRAAFNCPVGSAYAPKDHCDVWTSPPSA